MARQPRTDDCSPPNRSRRCSASPDRYCWGSCHSPSSCHQQCMRWFGKRCRNCGRNLPHRNLIGNEPLVVAQSRPTASSYHRHRRAATLCARSAALCAQAHADTGATNVSVIKAQTIIKRGVIVRIETIRTSFVSDSSCGQPSSKDRQYS